MNARQAQAGFTIVELVVVMMLMAVITAIGMTRFVDRDPFSVQGAADQLVSGLRVAQATALAQRVVVYVTLTAAPPVLNVCLDAGCSQPLAAPSGDAAWLNDAQDLHLSAAASFNFGADGTPSLASALQLQVLNASGSSVSPTVTVEAISGYVHSP